jgi:hypothetical protein
MKPTRASPASIIAHCDGSGTGVTWCWPRGFGPADAGVVEGAAAEHLAALLHRPGEIISALAAPDGVGGTAAGAARLRERGGGCEGENGEGDGPVMASHGVVSSDGDNPMARA